MNLVADIGNTLSKIGVFKGQALVKSATANELSKEYILNFLGSVEEKVGNVILTSVKSYPEELDAFFTGCFQKYFKLQYGLPLPVQLAYTTPETLGSDRIAAVAGASVHFPGKNVLVIDAGTCITYDFLNENLIHEGGSISPGIRMRFRALNNFTGQLPLIDWDSSKTTGLVGNSTETSILSGVVNGVLAEAEGIMARYSAAFPDLKVVVTGGDLDVFDKVLKKRIFADPNLVLLGLHEILRYNIEN